MGTSYVHCDSCELQFRPDKPDRPECGTPKAKREAPEPGQGCYRARPNRMPQWEHLVSLARQKFYNGSGAPVVQDWLADQYEALLKDESERRAFQFGRPVARTPSTVALERPELGHRRGLAEKAAQGVVVAFTRCPEPAETECHQCRYRPCAFKGENR